MLVVNIEIPNQEHHKAIAWKLFFHMVHNVTSKEKLIEYRNKLREQHRNGRVNGWPKHLNASAAYTKEFGEHVAHIVEEQLARPHFLLL